MVIDNPFGRSWLSNPSMSLRMNKMKTAAAAFGSGFSGLTVPSIPLEARATLLVPSME